MATSKMSTQPVQKFGEDLVNCSICFDSFKDAKVLPCLHSFCQSCITRHYEVYKLKNGNRLSCPTCRELLPVPRQGVAGLRSDNTITKTQDLLEQVCLEWTAAGYADQDDEHLGAACALPPIDFEQLEWKRRDLKDVTFSCQHTLTGLRSKLMNLYLVENHVKYTMDAECKALTAEKQTKGKAQLNANRVDMVKESHAVSLAQLATEQDRLFLQLEELRSVNDVIEEVLDKANPYQLQSAYHILRQFGDGVRHLLEKKTPSRVNPSDVEGDLTGLYLQELGLPPGSEAQLFNIRPPPDTDLRPVLRDKAKGDKITFELVFKISGRGAEPGCVDFPVDATLMPDGSVAVCDKNNCRIQIFNAKGEVSDVCLRGEVKPRRIRLSARDGCWYISDELSECVKVYSPNWRLIRRIGESTFQCPAGLAIDSKGNLIMTDAEKNFVSVHNPSNGEVLHKFYYQFLSDKLIACPYFACVNEDDQLIVSDMRNNQIKVFSQSGKVLFKIKGLCCPRGVCVDPYGNILVAEGDRHCVSMYSPHGKFIQHVLTKQDGLCFPMSLDMDMTGRLLITQWGFYTPHEVLLFQMC